MLPLLVLYYLGSQRSLVNSEDQSVPSDVVGTSAGASRSQSEQSEISLPDLVGSLVSAVFHHFPSSLIMISPTLVLIIFLYVFVFGGGCFVYLRGDPEGDGWIDVLHRFVFRTVPPFILGLIQKTCGKRAADATSGFWNYIVWQSNPLVAIFYACIICGIYLIFVFFAYPYIPNP